MFGYWDNSYYLIIVVQVLCILHALRSGRREWLYLLIFLPLLGCIIYFIRELLPEINRGEFFGNLQRLLFPNAKLKELERSVRISDTVTNRLNLAKEYELQRRYAEAIDLTRSCLTDLYANDVFMTLDLARLLFRNEQYAECIATFDKAMRLKNGRPDKPEDELLYVRALDSSGDTERACEEYERVIRVHHSIEARYHFGLLLRRLGRTQEASMQFRAIRDEKDLHPRYVRRLNAPWVRQARREMASL